MKPILAIMVTLLFFGIATTTPQANETFPAPNWAEWECEKTDIIYYDNKKLFTNKHGCRGKDDPETMSVEMVFMKDDQEPTMLGWMSGETFQFIALQTPTGWVYGKKFKFQSKESVYIMQIFDENGVEKAKKIISLP